MSAAARRACCKLVVRIARQSRIGGLHWTQGFGSGILRRPKTNRGRAGELTDQEARGRSNLSGLTRRDILALTAAGAVATAAASAPYRVLAAAPQGQLTWGVHVSLAPTWFDPAETPGIITPFMVLYALHDAMVKPMPGKPFAPCLAESWSSVGGRSHLRIRAPQRSQVPQRRAGHRGGRKVLVRALSRRRARADEGAGWRRSRRPIPRHVRFRLKTPWPDFLTFYASASGAGWIVPKKYVEQVGDEGFKKAPIGAGPYKFVSFTPGVELVLEAFDRYWRKIPSVKRLVMQGDPRRDDAACGTQARRDRHRLLDPRRTRRGAPAHAGADAQAGRLAGAVLALLSRAMGPEIAVA